jgi:Bax protein
MAEAHPLHAARDDVPGGAGATLLVVLFVAVVVIIAAVRDDGDGAGGTAPARPPEARADMPDFSAIPSIDDRKKRFFAFLRPVVEAENARLRQQRERLLRLRSRLIAGNELSDADKRRLDEMARRCRVEADDARPQVEQLLPCVDIIPTSLALAQAALESAWGTSRFAQRANNLFGLWCNTPGCGIVPKRRPEGKTYEVEAFADVGAAVRSYMNDLNAHPAYQPLRAIRARRRAQGQMPTGTALAAGLINYAAIGEQYVEHIRGVIRRNDLASAGH